MQNQLNDGKSLLLRSITNYYNNNQNYLNIFIDILNGNSKISLRLIDWLVTHYSKSNNIQYWIDTKSNIIYKKIPSNYDNAYKLKKFNLYSDYRAQLKSFSKKYFDPFRRHERISYIINENLTIETTLGQLNFFKWFFKHNIYYFVVNNHHDITNDMSSNSKNKSYKKKNIETIKKEKNIIRFD